MEKKTQSKVKIHITNRAFILTIVERTISIYSNWTYNSLKGFQHYCYASFKVYNNMFIISLVKSSFFLEYKNEDTI